MTNIDTSPAELPRSFDLSSSRRVTVAGHIEHAHYPHDKMLDCALLLLTDHSVQTKTLYNEHEAVVPFPNVTLALLQTVQL